MCPKPNANHNQSAVAARPAVGCNRGTQMCRTLQLSVGCLRPPPLLIRPLVAKAGGAQLVRHQGPPIRVWTRVWYAVGRTLQGPFLLVSSCLVSSRSRGGNCLRCTPGLNRDNCQVTSRRIGYSLWSVEARTECRLSSQCPTCSHSTGGSTPQSKQRTRERDRRRAMLPGAPTSRSNSRGEHADQSRTVMTAAHTARHSYCLTWSADTDLPGIHYTHCHDWSPPAQHD